MITLGHKGKAQIITTHGVSAHGSAPEKGINAVYGMAEIISRVDALNKSLFIENSSHGTVVLSDISSVSASLLMTIVLRLVILFWLLQKKIIILQ